jgi:integrase
MNIKIIPNGKNNVADIQFLKGNEKIRKRWVVPAKVYQHLKPELHEEQCKKWAAREVVKLLTPEESAELETEIVPEAPPEKTISDCFSQFLDQVDPEALGTRDRYHTDYDNYIEPLLGNLGISVAAEESTINNFRASLQKRQSKRSKTPKNLSPSTVNGALNTLRAFFDWAKIEKHIKEKATIKRVKQLKATKISGSKYYTSEQQDLILEIAYNKSPMIYAAFVCGLDLGLRIGECVGLKWEHIMWSKGEVEVSETVKVSKVDKAEVIRLPKNKTPDTVYMSDRCKDALRAIHTDGAKGRIFQRVRPSNRSKFKAGPVSVNVIGNWVEIITKIANAVNVLNKAESPIPITRNYHKFRHSLATNLADKEVYITKIQDHLRHKAITSTMQYLHSDSREDIRAAMESIGQGKQRSNDKLRIVK